MNDVYVSGKLKIETNESWQKKVHFENCFIEGFSAIGQQFEKQVTLKNCHFSECQFTSAYFCGGLIIDNCTSQNPLDFQAGGHNKTGNPVKMSSNDFKGFVNFLIVGMRTKWKRTIDSTKEQTLNGWMNHLPSKCFSKNIPSATATTLI